MTAEKSFGKFFVYCGLILIFLLVMVQIVFSFGGKFLKGELLMILFLMILSLVGIFGYTKRWGERVLFFVFLLGLANLVFIWYLTKDIFMLPMFLVMVGFLMSLPKPMIEEDGNNHNHSETFDVEEYGNSEEEEPKIEVIEDKKTETKKEFEPGKYVASKMGSVYHEPKCNWAKKIVKDRQVWFNDKKEAQKQKYKPHNCVN